MKDKLFKVFEDYLALISRDHHKRRDYYLSIGERYNMVEKKIEYFVVHDGYVNELEEYSHKSLEQAKQSAIEKIEQWIEEEKEYQTW